MARQTAGAAPVSEERLYLNSKGEIVGEEDPDANELVAAPGAAIAPEYHAKVREHLGISSDAPGRAAPSQRIESVSGTPSVGVPEGANRPAGAPVTDAGSTAGGARAEGTGADVKGPPAGAADKAVSVAERGRVAGSGGKG